MALSPTSKPIASRRTPTEEELVKAFQNSADAMMVTERIALTPGKSYGVATAYLVNPSTQEEWLSLVNLLNAEGLTIQQMVMHLYEDQDATVTCKGVLSVGKRNARIDCSPTTRKLVNGSKALDPEPEAETLPVCNAFLVLLVEADNPLTETFVDSLEPIANSAIPSLLKWSSIDKFHIGIEEENPSIRFTIHVNKLEG